MEIIFATKNEGKLKEINAMLAPINVLPMSVLGIMEDIVEDGDTFRDNAIIKAKAIGEKTDKIVLADDSGLEIDFLNGEPGVYSARYLGENTPYDIKNAKILEIMKDVPFEKRTARFVCVIAAKLPAGDIITKEGTIEGYIAHESKGGGGFGYDPIFFVPSYNMTTAEMSPSQKNEISHRGIALKKIKGVLLNEVPCDK